jgi:hypothetical protein
MFMQKFFIVYTATTEDNEQIEVIYGERETRKAAAFRVAELNREAGYNKYRLKVSR